MTHKSWEPTSTANPYPSYGEHVVRAKFENGDTILRPYHGPTEKTPNRCWRKQMPLSRWLINPRPGRKDYICGWLVGEEAAPDLEGIEVVTANGWTVK